MTTQDLEGEGSEISMEDSYRTDSEEESGCGTDSEEESGSDDKVDDDKEVAAKDAAAKKTGAAVADVPTPYLGQPFVTKSLVSTIDINLLRDLCKQMILLQVECIALRSNDSSKSLQHVLFENPVSFSTVAGKC